ncbi:MAG: UDP-N-acetylmuramate--L-alanine ligase [Candidatus Gracilibacteria bacterium]|nr:UDP-N-acetylmuramate--L-alanine ligase [Candidatus Gracilibacteria bacterium]
MLGKVHFIGIKGTGMSALASVLKEQGWQVTGSDVSEEFPTDRILRQAGLETTEFAQQHIANELDLVIYSAAYNASNPEYAKAQELGLKMLSYPEALGELSHDYFSIGVAGMHGKSTITAMLASVLIEMQEDPTVILGTTVPELDNRNFRLGKSKLLLAETCEYRRHFLNFNPQALILSNLEAEHMDYFKDLADIKDAFFAYIRKLPAGALLVYNGDDQHLPALCSQTKGPQKISAGFAVGNDFQAKRLDDQKFQVFVQGKPLASFRLAVPGNHNVLDALLVIAFCYSYKPLAFTVEALQKVLLKFRGGGRRLELKGEKKGITILDDFAHHPTEIKASLQATRERYPQARIWAVFMSHTYSRTETLLADFASSFQNADRVIINKIFSSAREKQGKVNGQVLTDEIKKNHQNVFYIPEFSDTITYLQDNLKAGDVVITMGAGDNYVIGEELLKIL